MKRKNISANKKKQISQEEIAKHWTLSDADKVELVQYRKDYRLFVTIQLCVIRLSGRFLLNCNETSAQVINYLARQLDLAPTLAVNSPARKATLAEQRQNILLYLGFKKYDEQVEKQLSAWLENQAIKGMLP